jgi:hypothetical protein
MRKPHPHLLLVEGKEDKRVIAEFIEKFIPWGNYNEQEKWPTKIEDYAGIEPLGAWRNRSLVKISRVESSRNTGGR